MKTNLKHLLCVCVLCLLLLAVFSCSKKVGDPPHYTYADSVVGIYRGDFHSESGGVAGFHDDITYGRTVVVSKLNDTAIRVTSPDLYTDSTIIYRDNGYHTFIGRTVNGNTPVNFARFAAPDSIYFMQEQHFGGSGYSQNYFCGQKLR